MYFAIFSSAANEFFDYLINAVLKYPQGMGKLRQKV
jgi:hypothetical protein